MGWASTKQELVGLSEWVWSRTRSRLEGLSDEEMFWEPYPGCWSVRQLGDGAWAADTTIPPPDVPPLTTIAWRLVHLTGCYGQARNSAFLAVEVATEPSEVWAAIPGTAGAALADLTRAQEHWHEILSATSDDSLGEPLGAIGGPWSEQTRSAFAFHMLDEMIHHGAELAVMRDLYRASGGPAHPHGPLVGKPPVA